MYKDEDMICSFCVNDYHLAVIIMPYIYEAINVGKNVITFLDRDLEKTANKVIITNQVFWKEESLRKIDFKKTRFDKLSKKFENIKDNDVIIVAGKDDFIERINKLILYFHTNFTIVNCFYVSDIAKDDNFKLTKYSKLLNTKGLEDIQKLDFV